MSGKTTIMKTRKIAILLGFTTSFFASAAYASDLPRRYEPVAPAYKAAAARPTFTWTGFYAGLHAGYGFGGYSGTLGASLKDHNGFVGGGQLGYNYQINDWVIGGEADLSATDMNSESSGGIAGSKARIPYIGSARARLGYSMDRFLPYLTAGYAMDKIKITIPGFGKASKSENGWVAGGGVDYAFTNMLIARVEGLYYSFGKDTILNSKLGQDVGVVRAGLNVKF